MTHSEGERHGLLSVAVALMTCAMLMFEILQTVILSLQIFSANAFLVVSIALLGLGFGGSLAAWILVHRSIRPTTWMWGCAVAFTLSTPLSTFLVGQTHEILPIIGAILPPFACMGLFLALLFSAWPKRSGTYYASDLLGSAAGCLIVILGLEVLEDAALVAICTAILAGGAAILLGWIVSRRHFWGAVSAVVLVVALTPFAERVFTYHPYPWKGFAKVRNDPKIESEVLWSKWGYLGRLDIIRPGKGIERLPFGMHAASIRDRGGEYRFLFASGDNWSYAIDFNANQKMARGHGKGSPAASPYVVTPGEEVLVIGVGGGVDLFMAKHHGAKKVIAAEINPLMSEALTWLGPRYWEGALFDPRVRVEQMDGRTLIDSTRDQFDLITLTAVDTGAGLAHGGLVLSENYLYTQEAFRGYFEHLKAGGVVYILRPADQLARILSTAVAALRNRGAPAPEQHFAIYEASEGGPDKWISALVFRDPVRPVQAEALRARLNEGDFGGALSYLPGTAPTAKETWATNWFSGFFKSVGKGDETEFLAAQELNMTALSDDRPFLYNWQRNFWESPAGAVLLQILQSIVLVAAILLFAPLYRTRVPRKTPQILTTLLYFMGIGFGFMLIEVTFIQKFALYLGHPSFSVVVTLFGMLVFAGLGSLAAQRLNQKHSGRFMAVLAGIVAITILQAFFAQRLLAWLPIQSLALRVVTVLLLLAPGSFLMGMPFPLKISALPASAQVLIPWAWAVNAFASVTASVLTVMLAINFGFNLALYVGAACYLLALVAQHFSPQEQA